MLPLTAKTFGLIIFEINIITLPFCIKPVIQNFLFAWAVEPTKEIFYLFFIHLYEKSCFQNKSKFITEEYFTKHIDIKTK